VNQEFQERVARVRMFSLEGTFRRFQRMARDLAIQQNKQIKVILTGLDTELDKEVIEHVTDPLKHLVRNCIDHGLETPQERRAKRKPPTGIMELKAYQRGGRIFVEISDDGRGIDVAGVQRKALERGWIEPDQVLSKEVLLELMYKPGFSTSSEVTEISGRGIGMDVVKTELEQLGGTIETHTEKDKGTTFILCLPLISALMEALHVMVHGASFLVPLQAIVGTEKFDNQLVKRPGPQERVYPFRGDYIPLVDISNTFDIGNASTNGDSTAVIFVDTGIKTFGIPVDEVLDPQQIIVKTLETNYRSVKGIGGATILGDGSISLVLDLLGLQEIFFENSFKGDATHESKEKAE
jgi:two-component system chemotaxis sensor kinase CheA